MPKSDKWPLLPDVAVAFCLLTRLPMPRLPDQAFARQARATWAFALVGAVVGLMAAGMGWLALWLGLPAAAAAGVVLGTQILVSGAMHEDGLGDTADGLWGGASRERRLEIMRDSAIGTYGVLALIGSLGLRWVALSTLLASGFAPVIAAAALSRALLPVVMTALPHARDDGLSRRVGRPGRVVSAVALGLGLAIALGLGGLPALGPVLAGIAGAAIVALVARARIGGQTGDILGACQQVAETAMLLGFLALERE